jgi:hypothetical protein
VLADGVVVGRIMNAAASPVGSPWLWTLAFGHHEDRGDGGFREVMATGLKENPGRAGASK